MRTSPLDSVTVPTVALAVVAVPPLALLLKVAVTAMTDPAGALVGRFTVVVTSATCTTPVCTPILFPGTGSVVPIGGVTLAVFVYAPELLATALTTTLAVAPVARLVVPLTELPLATAVTDPLTLWMATEVKLAGTKSLNVAPTTGDGPPLPITKVKVTVRPTATVGATLTLERLRSALGVTASVSDAEQTPATVHEPLVLVLVKPAGGATVATFRTEVCAKVQGEVSRSAATNNHGAFRSAPSQWKKRKLGERENASKMVPAVLCKYFSTHRLTIANKYY